MTRRKKKVSMHQRWSTRKTSSASSSSRRSAASGDRALPFRASTRAHSQPTPTAETSKTIGSAAVGVATRRSTRLLESTASSSEIADSPRHGMTTRLSANRMQSAAVTAASEKVKTDDDVDDDVAAATVQAVQSSSPRVSTRSTKTKNVALPPFEITVGAVAPVTEKPLADCKVISHSGEVEAEATAHEVIEDAHSTKETPISIDNAIPKEATKTTDDSEEIGVQLQVGQTSKEVTAEESVDVTSSDATAAVRQPPACVRVSTVLQKNAEIDNKPVTVVAERKVEKRRASLACDAMMARLASSSARKSSKDLLEREEERETPRSRSAKKPSSSSSSLRMQAIRRARHQVVAQSSVQPIQAQFPPLPMGVRLQPTAPHAAPHTIMRSDTTATVPVLPPPPLLSAEDAAQLIAEPVFVAPPRASNHARRVLHSQAYIRYIASMHNHRQRSVSLFDRSLRATPINTARNPSRPLPAHWLRETRRGQATREADVVTALWRLRGELLQSTTGMERDYTGRL